MKHYFLKLYQYNLWCNLRVIGAIKRQSINDEKILSVLGHIIVAQYLWLHRIQALPAPALKLWGNYSLSQLETMAEEIGNRWITFIESTDDFNRELVYKNYTNDPYHNNVEQIMIHLVNHSSYHRGQIAMLIRQKGFEPVNTDYITYDRVISNQLKLRD
jgi:uncharacterized damage-inducible protein DinB